MLRTNAMSYTGESFLVYLAFGLVQVAPPLVLAWVLRRRFGVRWAYAAAAGLTLAMVAFLASAAVPVLRGRSPLTMVSKPACQAILRQLTGAKEQWALENKKNSGDATDLVRVNAYLKNSQAPECPSGGTYSYNPVGQLPTCSIGGWAHSADPASFERAALAQQRTDLGRQCLTLGGASFVIWLAAVAFVRARPTKGVEPSV